MIERGDAVAVSVRGPSVLLRAKGVAQTRGRVGELISVLPTFSKRLVTARVVGPDEVEVEL